MRSTSVISKDFSPGEVANLPENQAQAIQGIFSEDTQAQLHGKFSDYGKGHVVIEQW